MTVTDILKDFNFPNILLASLLNILLVSLLVILVVFLEYVDFVISPRTFKWFS